MNAAALQSPPPAVSLDRARIPTMLKELPRWVAWRAGPPKASGKFDKVPIDPKTRRNVSANDHANWLSFDNACAVYDAGRCSGIGMALSDEPVSTWGGVLCGAPQYLVALDFDHCADSIGQIKELRKNLGGIYGEVSPSGKGVRMFALSRELIKGGNAGGGRELYSTGRFVTVTGINGYGAVTDATEGLLDLAAQWFPSKVNESPTISLAGAGKTLTDKLALSLAGSQPETTEGIARVKAQLAHIDADCDYERWRNVVWSVLSSNWPSAEGIARQWSKTALHSYDDKAFNDLARDFDPARGITLGTLDHYAREGGWLPVTAVQSATSRPDPESSQQRPKRLLTGQDLKAHPPTKQRIRGLLPAQGLASIYGPPGSAKTFLALDMGCAIAAEHSHWFGSKVKSAPVTYVALEGEGGIRQRVAAWELQHRQQVPDIMRFVLGNFTLLDASDSEDLAAEIIQTIGGGAVVIVDTLNQSAPGADENASADMSRVIANAKLLAVAVDGLVILVHHAGKDLSRGMRGHSSLFAAMDAVIEVGNTAMNGRSWRVAKSKDGVTGVAYGFELAPHTVGQDEDGLDITSCAVRRTLLEAGSNRKQISGKNQKPAYQVLTKLSAEHPEGVPIKAALAAVAKVLSGEVGRRTTRATEAITGLTESGHLQQIDGVVFLQEF
ncbi:MAG: hypothetical protein D4R79_12335 [Comamonadaceae bacterium]|nr:MAG: hypothetical protein D4R79_12335 [Comamonadaceae bacterium]